MYEFQYEGMRRVVYEGGPTFIPVCQRCGRFVKADETITELKIRNNLPTATCKKCGRTTMPFEGYI